MMYFGYFYFSCIHFELEMHSQHLDPLFIPNQIKKTTPIEGLRNPYVIKTKAVAFCGQMLQQMKYQELSSKLSHTQGSGLISVSGQLPTYPSPNPTLTLTCYQLTVVELGEG